MRAVDVYSGIGGWTCGLRLAGIDVVGSFEWWPAAVATNNANNGTTFGPVDVRTMDLATLPRDIDLVVGSPPCTQFSYANRGGGGDLDEGLKDIVRFLEIVRALQPQFWAMENVPRVAKILTSGFNDPAHVLYAYRDLHPQIEVVDFSRYGTPQVRKRCIASNLPFDVLDRLSNKLAVTTLGDVVRSLGSEGDVIDPTWGVRLPSTDVTERQTETPLTREELRLNREAKEHHPVYNNMAFPDPLDAPARTVTATCTRVSRESIVIFDERIRAYRRLSIRERASLQGFPITYQFYAPSYSQKVKMIGNAVPPTFSYLLALAIQDRALGSLPEFRPADGALDIPKHEPPLTMPDRPVGKYREARRFRAAISGLRFKSGVRFELCNDFSRGPVSWLVRFVHGTSKDIRELKLDGTATAQFRSSAALAEYRDAVNDELKKAEERLRWLSAGSLQSVWTRRADGMGPFEVIDLLADSAKHISELLAQVPRDQLEQSVLRAIGGTANVSHVADNSLPRALKLRSNAVAIASGLLVGDWFNCLFCPDVAKVAA
jgi:DNA (cytosine-5)-methyltransferase 1